MKAKIHPKYEECTVKCGCGNTFETCATQGEINVEICSACHPFYTGKQKLVDTAGRVEKFQRRYATASYHAPSEPEAEVAAPEVEAVTPAPEVAAPEADVATPAPEAAAPEAEVKKPDAEAPSDDAAEKQD